VIAVRVVVVGCLVLGACQPHPSRPTTAADDVGFPRCVASDVDGNAVACRAPKRSYDGTGCACADGRGRALYGRVQEYPRAP